MTLPSLPRIPGKAKGGADFGLKVSNCPNLIAIVYSVILLAQIILVDGQQDEQRSH